MQRLRIILTPLIFYPTLAWNVLLGRILRLRNWWDGVDERLILGALPFRRDVPKLAASGVTGVVNTCREYSGPISDYEDFQIEQFYMPTVDFTHPRFEDVCQAVSFIERKLAEGGKVYVHCKAGRARSATVAMCWMIKHYQITAQEAQQRLQLKRPHINPHLYERPVVLEYEKQFLSLV